jgi:ring-1,2-phenylacetyl-CoA epoxidase subunit PaaA
VTDTHSSIETGFSQQVRSAEQAREVGPDYVKAVGKVIASHVRNELAGADAFDEPAIALAETPLDKWLACRIAMEEFGHHLQFSKLANELGIAGALERAPLSVFEFKLKSWTEFVVLKAIVDLAEVILMEDLEACSYVPLRELSVRLMPEERYHVTFGEKRTRELASDSGKRPAVQQAINDLVRFTLPFFGRSKSSNNELFRRWGIKRHTNDESRAIFIERARRFTESLELKFPGARVSWDGEAIG